VDTNSPDPKANRQERDLPTTAADRYLTPMERRKGALLVKRARERARERLLTELDAVRHQQSESLESGVVKVRRRYRSGQMMTFRRFCSVLKDVLDNWDD
jgi:DNA-binding TFAR19-related protein (PDSD5 family)